MQTALHILGIETSCDDTAAAVLLDRGDKVEILSSSISSQVDLHDAFGGVVPEIAARAHAERIDFIIEHALRDAQIAAQDLDAIAVTAGPGLIGGVMAGSMAAKGLAFALGKPILAVNHLAGHALTPRLTDQLPFPYLMLLVSGGHCQFLRVDGPEQFERLGGTIDDAPGEAFDKVARLLGLPQPGGPSVEKAAGNGSPERIALPRPLLGRPGLELSFSGLKTAVMRQRDALLSPAGELTERDRGDICAAFQAAVADVLAEKSARALKAHPHIRNFAVAGGVAANAHLRQRLQTVADERECRFCAPHVALCTDNAAMIAYAGLTRFKAGARDGLDFPARPRWPLDENAMPMLGSGKKGAKA